MCQRVIMSSSSSESGRHLAARIGGLSLHIHGDSDEIAARARRGFDKRFENEALDLDPTLTGERLRKQVERLRRLYFTRLAAKSASARRKS